jgi:nucleoside-diphosphate-sugar epimerase
MKKILITGIAGFIGSNLAKHLVHDGHTVTGIDNLKWGYEEDVPDECLWLNRNICELYSVEESYDDGWGGVSRDIFGNGTPEEVFGDVDVIIHCAANIEVLASLDSPVKDLQVNTEGTIQVLEAMKYWGIKNLINFSSACVYGRGAVLMTPNKEFDVRLTDPHWPYAASKLAAEIYCNLYVEQDGINVIHVRPGIVCGPREWYGRALTIFLRRAMEGLPIVVFTDPMYEVNAETCGGDGTPRRDLVHINDVVAQVRACLKNYPDHFSGARTFNMGAEKQVSIMQMARKVADTFNVGIVEEELDQGAGSQLVPGRVRIPHEMEGMLLDMRKAKTELNHVAVNSSLPKIIDSMVTWLKGGGLERWQKANMKV